ncbi:MAG: FG-GAP-like repeat-containing protein, partial [Methanomassiliicoccales archaeon]
MKYSPSGKRRSKKSGVSDIIGNLLILAMTVVLFSSVLFYVNSMPGPDNETYADFSYELTPGSSTTILNVTKSGGETLNDGAIAIALIINDVNSLYTISDGGVGETWDLGEKWSITIGQVFDADDTVEMMIIDNVENNVVWTNTLLGSGADATYAPVITDKGLMTSPSYVGDTVYFYCKIVDLDGDLVASSVTVDLSALSPAPSPAVFSMTYQSASGYYVSDAGLTLTADSTGAPNWNRETVLFSAQDEEDNSVQASYMLTIYKESGGQDQHGPYWDWTSYLVNGTYPADASGGESSGQEGGVGTTFYYIRNAATLAITDQFQIGDKVTIEIYSTALRNLALENTFSIFQPITGLAITPQSSSTAFSYAGIYGTFYAYRYNFTVPSEAYIYPIQFKLKDNFGTVINVADTITVGGGTYPQLTTYKYVSSTSMVKASDYNHTDVLYLQIKTKDVDLSASTLYVSDIQISDYSGRYIIKKSPGTYASPVTYTDSSKPVSSVFKASTTNPTAGFVGTNGGYYTVYIVLKDAYQGWWLPGKNAYTIKITMVSDQGTGTTTGEVYYSVTTQINVTAPLTTTDILASVGSGSFEWSASGAAWTDNKIAWYSGGEQWDETIIDDAPNDGPIGLVLADIDGDGDDDVVVGFQDATYANIVWYENQKSDGSTWSSARSIALPFDALSGTQASGNPQSSRSNSYEDVSVYSTQDGGFVASYSGKSYVNLYELCSAISVGDFDGDGDGDIVASYIHVVVYSTATSESNANAGNSYGMYFNRGVYVFWNDGAWTKTLLYSTNDWISGNDANENDNPAVLDLDTGDFNGDGCDDIVGAYETGKTSVWLSRYADNTGSVTTKQNAAFSTSSSLKTVPPVAGNTPWSHKMYPPCVEVADMNNDGLPDIVRTSNNDNSVTVFYTQGSYTDTLIYSPDVEFSIKSDPSTVT